MVIIHEEQSKMDQAFDRMKQMKYGQRPDVDEDLPNKHARHGRIWGAIGGAVLGGATGLRYSGNSNTSKALHGIGGAIAGGLAGAGLGHFSGKATGSAERDEQRRMRDLYDKDPSMYDFERKRKIRLADQARRDSDQRLHEYNMKQLDYMHDRDMQRRDQRFKLRYNKKYRR